MARTKRSTSVIRRADGSLVIHLDGPNAGGNAEIGVVPAHDGSFRQGYVWVGTSSACFGHVSLGELLALAAAARKAVVR
jgi:hypothetical protein